MDFEKKMQIIEKKFVRGFVLQVSRSMAQTILKFNFQFRTRKFSNSVPGIYPISYPQLVKIQEPIPYSNQFRTPFFSLLTGYGIGYRYGIGYGYGIGDGVRNWFWVRNWIHSSRYVVVTLKVITDIDK